MSSIHLSRRAVIGLVIGLLLLGVLACGTVTTTGGNGAVQVVNNSSATICYVYISPSTSTEWGEDQLGAENTIPPGSSFTVQNIPPGTYDFRADDCSNTQIDVEQGITVNAGQTVTWTFTDN